ncbi:hypothetical protein [Daejeonella sp.]|jgi:hypothetical protein|uniref:hypothetical protein n=1 Tax=Daejeonella sp. TaxID=2805397 RepID=UPI003783141E
MKQNSYIQNILHYFSQLDWDRLYFYLKEEYAYQDTSKEIFLSKVKKIFQAHIQMGDTELILTKGQCKSKICDNCGKSGYRFIGNNSRNYIDLIFETSGDDITDIYDCSDFSTKTDSGKLERNYHIFIEKDEAITFNKSPEYWAKVNSANMAYDELISNPPKEIDYEGLSYWVEKYTFTNKTIGRFSVFNPKMKWSHFSELYDDLYKFKSYIDLYGSRFNIENTNLEQITTEEDLINWVIGTETLYEQVPFGINIEKENENYYALDKIIILVGDRLSHVSKFHLDHSSHREQLIKKYYSYTKQEEREIYSRENEADNHNEIWKLSFHLENRKKSKELGVEIPFFLD